MPNIQTIIIQNHDCSSNSIHNNLDYNNPAVIQTGPVLRLLGEKKKVTIQDSYGTL
jgi:hypothetical protein